MRVCGTLRAIFDARMQPRRVWGRLDQTVRRAEVERPDVLQLADWVIVGYSGGMSRDA